MNTLTIVLCLVMGLILEITAGPAQAQPIQPVSYTFSPGGERIQRANGEWVSYRDETGTQLTDQTYGVDRWYGGLEFGPAYEWVGWWTAEPVITVDFGETVSLSTIYLDMMNGGSGINLPRRVDIAFGDEERTYGPSTTYSVDYRDYPEGRTPVDFDVTGREGRYLRMQLHDGYNEWMLLDEMEFDGGSSQPVPELSTAGLFLMGAAGIGFLSRMFGAPVEGAFTGG